MARKRGENDDPLDPPEDEQDTQDEPEASADDDTADDDATDNEAADDDTADDDDANDSGDGDSSGGGAEDLSDTPAPSIGPKTTFTKDDPEERLARHEQSTEDAMGLDKRREVIGGTYGPTVARQLTTYGIFIAVVAAIVIGFVLLANHLDQPPDKYKDEAPWSQANAKQIPPPGIDFPNYGHPGPGEDTQTTPGESSGASSSENAADVETP
jgi:hypothetical protein